VPPAERLAVFDNDGTLWCEKAADDPHLRLLARYRQLARHEPLGLSPGAAGRLHQRPRRLRHVFQRSEWAEFWATAGVPFSG
jgi:hypothetical protein